jgi:adenylosuccinate synthase
VSAGGPADAAGAGAGGALGGAGAVLVIDLGFGDAGKGSVVDWICATRTVHVVVRFNGGAQAGHNVVLRDGRHHTFAQFGAGTFRPGVRTHLSRFVVVDPLALAKEAGHLAAVGVPDAIERLTVDRAALLATPYHRAANRARELARGDDRHGSCGMGVGETMEYALAHPGDAPVVGDCASPRVLARKLTVLRERLGVDGPPVDDCLAAFRRFGERVSIVDSEYLGGLLRRGLVVFEGAQGVLLDEWHGFHPYTTWSTTTFANAETLLAEAGRAGDGYRLGVVRTLTTRHGPGPLVTEDPTIELPEPHNPTNRWQGSFRVGHFDAVAHRYARDVAGGVDGVALTHLDRAVGRICRAYDDMVRLTPGPAGDLTRQEALTARLLKARPIYDDPPQDWVAAVADVLRAPVVLGSFGPSDSDFLEVGRLTAAARSSRPLAADR